MANNLPLTRITFQQDMSILYLFPAKLPLNDNLERSIHKFRNGKLNKQIPQFLLIRQLPTSQPTALPPDPLPLQQRYIQLFD